MAESRNGAQLRPVTIALPVAIGNQLVGSSVFVHQLGTKLFFVSCLHLFGGTGPIQVVTPAHGGNCNLQQVYPATSAPAAQAIVVAADPLADLVILMADLPNSQAPLPPPIAHSAGLVGVGTEVVVLGYPFAPLGSILETWTPCFVSALARRRISGEVQVEEIVLTAQAHPGSSGSAVVGKHDGVLYGIVRGSLAPPEVIRIGDIPIATDTSVTFGTSAHVVHDLIEVAVASATST